MRRTAGNVGPASDASSASPEGGGVTVTVWGHANARSLASGSPRLALSDGFDDRTRPRQPPRAGALGSSDGRPPLPGGPPAEINRGGRCPAAAPSSELAPISQTTARNWRKAGLGSA